MLFEAHAKGELFPVVLASGVVSSVLIPFVTAMIHGRPICAGATP